MTVLDTIKEAVGLKAKKDEGVIYSDHTIPSVDAADAKDTDNLGIFKAYIPNFLYKPPYGYPRPENLSLIRNLATSPYVYAIMKTISDEITNLKWDIKVKDGIENPEQYDAKIKEIKDFFNNPNSNNESWKHIQRAAIRDIVEIDSGVIVKVFNRAGEFKEMYARDGITFLKNPDIYGSMLYRSDFVVPIHRMLGLGTFAEIPEQVATKYYDTYAVPRAAFFQYGWTAGARPVPFGKREIVYMMQNPRSDSPYGRSNVEINANVIMILHYGTECMLDYYLNSGMAEGLISIPGASPEELKALDKKIRHKIIMKDGLGNQRRVGRAIPMTSYPSGEDKGGKGITFTQFALGPKDLQTIEQQEHYSKILWQSFGVVPDEMGVTDNSNRATSGEQSKVNKRKAIRPICSVIKYNVDTQILPEWFVEQRSLEDGGKDDDGQAWNEAIKKCPVEYVYDDYDIAEDLQKHQLAKMKVEMGIPIELFAEDLEINVEELTKMKKEKAEEAQKMAQQLGDQEGANNTETGENEAKKPAEEEDKKKKQQDDMDKKAVVDGEVVVVEEEEKKPLSADAELEVAMTKYIRLVGDDIDKLAKGGF